VGVFLLFYAKTPMHTTFQSFILSAAYPIWIEDTGIYLDLGSIEVDRLLYCHFFSDVAHAALNCILGLMGRGLPRPISVSAITAILD